MMSNILRTLFLIICITSVQFKNVFCDQPKFTSHEGDFIFQSAEDKNITIRLGGSSSFLINDINVLDSLQKFSEETTPTDDIVNVETLPTQVQVLKTDVQRFAGRLRRFENRSLSLPSGRIRTLQTRLLSLYSQVTDIKTKILTDDCLPTPCKNGGTCFDLYENFHCECPNNWEGKTCETDVDECQTLEGTDLGCQNKAACINLPGSFRCNCTNGFVGAHCRDRIADCAKSRPGELCGNGQCIPANNALGYKCLCNAGWKIDNITQSCTVDVNECLEALVSCHTSCTNLPGSFMCGSCPSGYTGDGVKCRDINECERNNGDCSTMPKVQCINTEGSHRCGNCPPGWTGDGRYCSQAESNTCESNNICHPLAKCQYISNMMVCMCPAGMTGSGYGQNGCRSGSASPCNELSCQNGGTCVPMASGATTCICPPGFEPPNCQVKDPCLLRPCLNGGTCVKRQISNDFTCTCRLGYSGDLCQNERNACGGVIRDLTGELKHPSEGSELRPNQACAWVIRTDLDFILNVTITKFDLPTDPSCLRSWLQINDGRSLATPVIGRFCGHELPNGGNILSSHNTLFLWFRADNTTNPAGFSLSWTSVSPICGGRLNVDEKGHGVIKSPGYPGKSPPNRDCEWDIEAPLGKRLLFRFFEVVMDRSENCTKDALIIYDGSEILEQVCETGVPQPKYSSTNLVKVHFHTDSNRKDSMFQAHYEVVEGKPGCGGLFTEPKGKIIITADLTNCVFLIQQPVGTKISIVFVRDYSEYELVEFKIYDGKTDDDPVLAVTDEDSPPGNYTSTGNSLLIVAEVQLLLSLPMFTVKLFEANFIRVCGQDLRDPAGGTFMTPNYPKPYYASLNCVYSIVGPPDSVVHLNITDYDVSEYSQGCDNDADYIEVYFALNGSPERHCKGVQTHIVASSNYLNIVFHSNTNPQKRRGISAKYYFESIGCGGVLREKIGDFEAYSTSDSTKGYCEWILEAPESNVIWLDLQYIRLGTKCTPGEVDMRIFLNGTGTNEGRLVESHCGDEKRVLTILPTNLATIFLKLLPPSSDSGASYGFFANYSFIPRSSNCGGNYSLLSGSIQSPGWPDVYPSSMGCIWVIHAPLGSKIELVPKNFSLEPGYTGCGDDYLQIRNGISDESPLIGTFCGNEIPPHIPSFTNHLYLYFRSDSSLNFPGFDITFQQTTTGCGGSLTSHSGSITSPHYPELSPGPVQCDWKITISKGSSIDIRITKLGATTNLCSNDVLVIYDGADSLAKKIPMNCSSEGDLTLRSSQNMIFVRYVLPNDGADEDQQFYLEYKTNCKLTLDPMEGVIESPNFPKEYPDRLKCEWSIVGRKADTISLTFSHFELEAGDLKCLYDKFEVNDMKGEESLQTHKICQSPTGVLRSDGNKFVIKFETDFNNGGKGFRLEYKRNGCGEYKTNVAGWLNTPSYPYSIDVDCEWLIDAPPGMQIVLDISDIHIEGSDENCTTNGLIVKNEKTDTRNLFKTCSVQSSSSTVTSHGSTMFVRFYSDSIRSRKYLKASYRQKQGQCGGVFRSSEGEIISPNYPQNYSIGSYCEWIVSVETQRLAFDFDDLELPIESNCSKGFVEIYDGLKSDKQSKLVGRFCSKSQLEKFNAPIERSLMNVIFSSEDGPSSKGFVLNFRKLCGGVLRKETGIIRSNEQDRNCSWVIEAEPGSHITVSFMHVECHCNGLSAEDCSSVRGITIQNNKNYNLKVCQEHPPDINYSGTSLSLQSFSTTFTARYTTTETACGGELTSFRGSIASPFYPESYPSNVECIWTLKAPSGNYLDLSFNEMNITGSENCNQDYLEVRESSTTGRLLGVFCSVSLPKDNLQIYERAWIKFRSSEGSTGKGFRLSWTNAQLNEITGFNGRIKPPSVMSIRFEKEPFQWRITVPRDNVISLTFKEYNAGLKLYDGFDNTGLEVDIQLSPWQVTLSTNVIYLYSDNELLDDFIIEWKAVSKAAIAENQTLQLQTCNETLNIGIGAVVTISSPGYPYGYETDLQCQWLIKSNHPTRHAVIKLNEVRLESLDSCYADHLKIFSSSNLMSWHEELKICDSPPKGPNPVAEIHGTPYLKLELTTDSSINKTGFTGTAHSACGSNLTDSIGRILDIDVIGTGSAMSIQNCTWHIVVGTGRKIKFSFDFPESSSEKSSDQCENYAIIRDGTNEGAPILPPGRICSYEQINGTIITTTNRASVKYFLKPSSTFFAYEGAMWNLTYREYSECGGEVRLTTYSQSVLINSPNYPNVPNPHTECVWIVIAPPGEAVKVEFVSNFDMNVRQCWKEFIEFRDGATEIARKLGQYCTKPGTVRSSGNVLYMRYLTDIAEPRNGFKANVSLSTCGGTYTQYNNLITSVNYPAPGSYPAYSICEYVIKVPTFARVNLTFLDVDLPFDAANLNNSDHIKIYQILQGDADRVEDELAVIYGNTSTPPAVPVDTNEILIRFYSFKANTKYRGFKIKYERIFGACYRDVYGESGVLTLSIVPRRMAMFLLCRWKITVPKGRRVKLDILEVDGAATEFDSAKNFRTTFYNDFQMLSRITMLDLNNITKASSISSSDNKMFVRVFGAYTTSLRRMRVAYSSYEDSGCPEDITNDMGSLSIASLNSSLNFFCSLDFILNGAQTLAFNISRLIVENRDQHLPSFAVRVRNVGYLENIRVLNSNMSNEILAFAPKHGSINILQNDGGGVNEFEATYRKHPCGGEYRFDQSFKISMPNLTAGYGGLDCAWQLSTSFNKIGYDLTANFSFTLPCEEEFVSVFAGLSSEMEVAKLCRGVSFNISRLASPQAYVYYHTKSYSKNSQMQIAFQRATKCGGKINLSGAETLQFTSRDYKNNLECLWDVETFDGFYLQVEFNGRFFIEESKDCTKDYLEIRKFQNNDWVSLPRYCGRNLPSIVNTTSAKLQLVFRSDESNTGDGFSLTIRKTCYAVFNVTTEPQLIKYPTRWSMTRVRMFCDYILQTDSDKYIQVNFKKFVLGHRNRCTLTQFTAQKRSSEGDVVDMGPYCKDNAVKELRAQKNISLSYQAMLETEGYEIEFFLDDCGGEVRKPMWISSLKNEEGDGYAHNMNCVWNITAPEGHSIIIKFKYLDLEEYRDCSLDNVKIYKGSQVDSENLEATLCGNQTIYPPSFHIESTSAILAAVSDSSVARNGFSARIMFSLACDERITLTEANSPVDIDRNITVAQGELMSCNIRVMGPPGFRVEVNLKQISLNPLNRTCRSSGVCEDCNYLEIIDSVKAGSAALGTYCSLGTVKPKLISSFKDVIIRTNLEQPGSHRFIVNLRLVPADCGSQSEYVLQGDSGVQIVPLRNPNGLYKPNTHCTWKITSESEFELKFTNFSLQNVSDVTGQCLDYVLIRYSTVFSRNVINEHCGSIPLYVVKVERSDPTAIALVTFHTDEAMESTGFTLTATNVDACNRTYSETSGIVGGVLRHYDGCINDILLPENYSVIIYIPSLYLTSTNCSENYVRVIDKKTTRQIYEDCTETYYARKIYTSTNQVRLDVKVQSTTQIEMYYYGSPKSALQGCGGNIEMQAGYLFSPNYKDYRNSSVCRWNLTTTAPNRIEIIFHEFNMGSSCKTDYLNIIETGDNGKERISRHFCEQNQVNNFLSETNRVSIVSVAAADFDGTGWSINFQTHSEIKRKTVKVDEE